MFKKLLIGGALAAGITLTGGIGTASASIDIPWINCYSSPEKYDNGIYTKYLVKEGIVFLDVRHENGIKWYLKGFKKLYVCGMNVYVGKYEGVKQ
ncbi:LCI family antimicrobial peptide [Xenorhabdus sp. XENO-10]|uniref:LCI family antimicrobial peptide n=1 Tax=Xenorhabdus yunnanensis TaxID=3025878 RepID=A0ABT5LIV3_9GAMM|nr:LCI family antimicrobial peptide [Xenorhabdus yunnanensis]MDC9590413.1 LCI family antimicrobial peptide [Xenorhabdus yunnanensis]